MGPTSTPFPTPTPVGGSPVPTATPGPQVEALPPLPADCIVSASPPEAFNGLGQPHRVYFLCGSAAATLPGPATNPYPTTGCFDVQASATDVTSGATVPFDSILCGGVPLTQQQGTSCSRASNPICAAGTSPTGAGQACSNCPANFTYRSSDMLCHFNPGTGSCPAGSTAVRTSSGTIADCTEAPQSTTPTLSNVVVATINPGAPHDYLISFTGYVGTTSSGTCPPNTQFVPQVDLTPSAPGSDAFSGPACRFTVSVEKKYIEGTALTIVPIGSCGEFVPADITGTFGGTPCFFEVKATGTVILKQNVNCTNGTEPTTGTDATTAGFAAGSTYACTDNTLKVVNVPVPNVPIDLSTSNGIFNPTCIPQSRRPTATPTATTTAVGPPTSTPVPTNTPASTPTPTASPTPVGGTPTPVPGTSGPAFCGPPGSPTTTVVTDQNGIAGEVGQQIFYSATAVPAFPSQRSYETIVGQFQLDGAGVPNVQMLAAFTFPGIGTEFCDSGTTNAAGLATCTKYINDTPSNQPVNVAVNFLFNCTEFDTATSFTPVGLGTPTPTAGPNSPAAPPILSAPAPNGICVLRNGSGTLTVTASFTSTINSQPSLSTGPVTLGTFGANTPTETPTSTAIVVPSTPATGTPGTTTATVVASPTAGTPTPTVTSTPTSTATPTPTAAPTSTAIVMHTLRFSLDAARVSTVKARANRQGLNAVKQGQKVWLMMYFTIKDLPRKVTRVTSYEILDSQGRALFRVAFKGTVGPPPQDLGSTVRYTTYLAPGGLPFGVYQFRATLKMATKSQTRVWKFAVVRASYTVSTGSRRGMADYVVRR